MSIPSQAQPQASLPLWSGDAPGALGQKPQDIPTVTLYAPEAGRSNGCAVIICPGGGYWGLAEEHEGDHYARWLSQHGVTGIVLRYRVAEHGYRHPTMLQDASRAMRLTRSKAAEWKIDPRRIGIMGSSAGGHLAATLLTHFDDGQPDAVDAIERHSSRPDFGVLCYPVISMGPQTHEGSRNNLLGSDPSPELVQEFSNELQVTPRTPPCFIWHTLEDTAVKVENSLEFASALRRSDVPFDLHIYHRGAHGIGLNDKPPFANPHPWARDLTFWLHEEGLLSQ